MIGHRAQSGSTVLEFALTLPLFLLLFSAVIDFGWLFYEQSALDGAIHDGCRKGAYFPNISQEVGRGAEGGMISYNAFPSC